MSLTTPVPRDLDTVFPGENWFFYWKTSASLWKSKLMEFPGTKIIVPINWSFHSETGDIFDFDDHRPETNLLKLVEIAKEVGKQVIFFLPVTPAPFLSNGGLPHLLARSLALNSDQMAYGIIDADDHLIKIYSFFDPRVFEAFDKFVKKLGQYFAINKINADVWGIRSGYFKDGHYRSFLEDTSKTFDQAFSRFVQTKRSPSDPALSAIEERQLAFEFNKTIQGLYETNARESLGGNFEGTLDVAFLGASTENFLKRLSGTISTIDYSSELYEALAKDIIPSSVLISPKQKAGVLGRELNDLVANSYLPARLASSAYEHEDISVFLPLSFFKVYERVDGISSLFLSWSDLHLWSYLKDSFGWSYKVISSDTLKLHENKTPYQEHVHLFHGHDVDRVIFNFILKTFMNGGRIILNRSGLSDEFSKRFETFFLENNLVVEKVNFQTQIQNINLGEGRLILVEGEGFKEMNKNDFHNFWKTLVETFSLVHVPIQNVDGIDFYWRTRPSSANELRFEEVRRLSLYNPTSYRKKIKMSLTKNFVVYKVIDEINVIVQTYPNELEIELSPEGSVIVDFGVFS